MRVTRPERRSCPVRPDLTTLQSFLQVLLTHPGTAEEAARTAPALALLPVEDARRVARGRGELSGLERIDIYREMYLLRMYDALSADYPALLTLFGERRFRAFVRDYVAVHPSRSYTLNRLGDHVPGFVKSWAPKGLKRLSEDLARISLALTETFDAEDRPGTAPRLDGLTEEALLASRFGVSPALRIALVSVRALDAFDALKAGERAPRTVRSGRTAVLFSKENGAVVRREEPEAAGFLLHRLGTSEPLGEAVAATLSRFPRTKPAEIQSWLRAFVSSSDLRAL